jgi:predicted transcriptional regulator
MYVDILKVLARHGPLKLTHIMYKANVNCSVLKEYLNFLMQQNLIEEKTVGKKRIVYAITQRGLTVLKYFRELKTVLPIVEENHGKRLPPSLY